MKERRRVLKREHVLRTLIEQAAAELRLHVDIRQFPLYAHEDHDAWVRQAERIGEHDLLLSTAEDDAIPLHATSQRHGIPLASVLVYETYAGYKRMMDVTLASTLVVPGKVGERRVVQRVFPCVVPHAPENPEEVMQRAKNAVVSALLFPDIPDRPAEREAELWNPYHE